MARVLVREIKQDKKNYILNGNFELWQRGFGNVTGLGSVQQYHADRFQWAAGTITAQVTSFRAPVATYANYTSLPRTCNYMQQYSVTTAQPSLSAGSTAGPWIKVEGYDIQDMLEQGALSSGFILSFYVASSVTGTYTLQFSNGSFNNNYFTTYTINSANTWQRVSIQLTAAEVLTGISSGTWNYTNGIGMYLRFWLASGTGAHGVNQNVWTSSTNNIPAAQVNFLSTLSNSWGITGIMLNVGNTLPDFRMRGESQADELGLCQRYYEKTYNIDTQPASITAVGIIYGFNAENSGTSNPTINHHYKVRKRANPTTTYYNSVTGAVGTWRASGGADLTVSQLVNSENGASLQFTTPLAAGNAIAGHLVSDAEL